MGALRKETEKKNIEMTEHRRTGKVVEVINCIECRFRVTPVEMPVIKLLWQKFFNRPLFICHDTGAYQSPSGRTSGICTKNFPFPSNAEH
jgi:hypothetical protein